MAAVQFPQVRGRLEELQELRVLEVRQSSGEAGQHRPSHAPGAHLPVCVGDGEEIARDGRGSRRGAGRGGGWGNRAIGDCPYFPGSLAPRPSRR